MNHILTTHKPHINHILTTNISHISYINYILTISGGPHPAQGNAAQCETFHQKTYAAQLRWLGEELPKSNATWCRGGAKGSNKRGGC